MNLPKKILFILPVATQPRYAKRVQSYIDRGYHVMVAAFERVYFEKNELPRGIPFLSLGKIKSGKYVRRVPVLIWGLFQKRRLFRSQDELNVFSADVLVAMYLLFRHRNIRYEVGDIRVLSGRISAGIFDKIYSKALFHCFETVVTSGKFKEYLAARYALPVERIKVIENRLSSEVFPPEFISEFKPIGRDELRVGIIGLLRYRNILEFLSAHSEKRSRFGIRIHGDGPLKYEIDRYLKMPCVTWSGQFKYPDDVRSIYDGIDLSFVMYDSTDLNVRLALPNKLYEAMYFRKPLIVSSGTYLSEKVEQYKIGISWDQNDMRGLVEYLGSDEFFVRYNNLKNSFDQIDPDTFLY